MHRINIAGTFLALNGYLQTGLTKMNRKALLCTALILTFLTLAILSYRPVNAQNGSNAFQSATNNIYFFEVLAGIIAAAVITVVVIILCVSPDVLRSYLLE